MSAAAPDSALIVRLSSIGDVIHTLPAYAALRDAWPDTRLGWAVEPAAAPLVQKLAGPLRVHVIDTAAVRRSIWRRSTRRAVRQSVRDLREARYDLAFDFQGLIKSAAVARLSRARVLGLARQDMREGCASRLYDEAAPAADPDGHILERSLGVVRAAGVEGTETRFPRVHDDDDDAYVAAELDRAGIDEFIVAHGAANWPSKRWPRERLTAVGRDLYRRTGLTVLWAWGPSEQLDARRLAALAGEGNEAAFLTTLPQMAALLARARLFVGGDSAPLHLAAAARTPTVAIFGPTSPTRLGPVDPADRVAMSRQPCSFCHRRRCPIGTRACLETLTADVVVQAAIDRLATSIAAAG